MNNIIYDDEIITPKNNNYSYYEKFIKKLNVRDCVKFALFCAKIADSNTKESFYCIALIEKWLKDENSVTSQELFTSAVSTAYASTATTSTIAAYTVYCVATNANAVYYAAWTVCYARFTRKNIINDINLYLQTLLRTTKQYNTKIHNNQHYESILKEIINEDIDKLTDTDYNMLIDLSQEYYNINPNITNKRIFIELLRKEYE